mmetsp:Transcript_6728/g.17460  ORF Transcript_6728/g.17460 Transcript_6728/m.17460 type:complete len:233 (+) Transcript_6728:1109-1807(+)
MRRAAHKPHMYPPSGRWERDRTERARRLRSLVTVDQLIRPPSSIEREPSCLENGRRSSRRRQCGQRGVKVCRDRPAVVACGGGVNVGLKREIAITALPRKRASDRVLGRLPKERIDGCKPALVCRKGIATMRLVYCDLSGTPHVEPALLRVHVSTWGDPRGSVRRVAQVASEAWARAPIASPSALGRRTGASDRSHGVTGNVSCAGIVSSECGRALVPPFDGECDRILAAPA